MTVANCTNSFMVFNAASCVIFSGCVVLNTFKAQLVLIVYLQQTDEVIDPIVLRSRQLASGCFDRFPLSVSVFSFTFF